MVTRALRLSGGPFSHNHHKIFTRLSRLSGLLRFPGAARRGLLKKDDKFRAKKLTIFLTFPDLYHKSPVFTENGSF